LAAKAICIMSTRANRLQCVVAVWTAGAAFGAIAATFGTALVPILGTVQASAAEDVSNWDGDARSSVRVIAGAKQSGANFLRAGVEVRLTRGWHTYWRYPGDSGVPPQFGFTGSVNVKGVDVLWPAPVRKVDNGGTSIGYATGVIFPLRVVPQDASKPVLLRLRMQYAICEKLCVPAEARGELTLASGRASQDATLTAAEARVPQRLNLGEGGDLSIQSVRRERVGGDKERVVVDVVGPAGVDLFAEGPNQQWAFPVPTPVAGAPAGVQRFAFDLDGAPTGASYDDAPLTLTAVTPSRAIEVVTRLD
jgi:DsbC/DsbD-like thiol-disulfide interchange protein